MHDHEHRHAEHVETLDGRCDNFRGVNGIEQEPSHMETQGEGDCFEHENGKVTIHT